MTSARVLVIGLGLVGIALAPLASACAELWGFADGIATDTITGETFPVRYIRTWSGTTAYPNEYARILFNDPSTGLAVETPRLPGSWDRRFIAFGEHEGCRSMERIVFVSEGDVPTDPRDGEGRFYDLQGPMFHCFDDNRIFGDLVGHYLHYDLSVQVRSA